MDSALGQLPPLHFGDLEGPLRITAELTEMVEALTLTFKDCRPLIPFFLQSFPSYLLLSTLLVFLYQICPIFQASAGSGHYLMVAITNSPKMVLRSD